MSERKIKLRLEAEATQAIRDLDKFTSATEKLAAASELAAREVDVATAKQKKATAELASAEQNLKKVRESGKASAREIASAELKVQTARRDETVASQTLTTAEQRLAQAKVASTQEAVKQASSAKRISAMYRENRADIDNVSNSLVKMGSAGMLTISAATKAAMTWESSWAGVKKTVNGTDAELEKLQTDLRDMAKALPSTHSEIAEVAAAAGQLGIQTKWVKAFTRTMIDLGETTNLSANDAATSIARFKNIMGTSQNEADRTGSTIVALGNNFATTESEIMEMSMRLAGAGKQAKMTEADVLGVAAGMSSVGIEAEAGGSAMSTTMKRIQKEVESGSKTLDTFAKVAGMSSQDFTQAWKTDAAGALNAFLTGLGTAEQRGMSANAVLTQLGITGMRESDALLRLSSANDLLTNSLALASDAFEENTALVDEANVRYATTESQVKMAWNSIKDGAIEIGSYVLPIVADLADGVGDVAEWFASLPEPVKQGVTTLGGFVSVGGLAAGVSLKMAGAIGDSVTSVKNLAAVSPRAAKGVKAVSVAAGVATTAITALMLAAAYDGGKSSQGYKEMEANIRALGEGAWATDTIFKNIDFGEGREANFKGFLDTLSDDSNIAKTRRGLRDLGNSITDFVGADTRSSFERQIADFNALDEAMGIVAGTDLESVQRAFSSMNLEAGNTDQSAQQLISTMPALRDALIGIANDAGMAVDDASILDLALGRVGISADGTAASTNDAASSTGDLAGGLEDAAQAADDAFEALMALANGVLNMRDAERGFEAAIDDANAAVKQAHKDFTAAEIARGDALDITTEAGRKNQEVLDALAQKGLARVEAARAEGATEEELAAILKRTRKEYVNTATDMGMAKDEARALADSIQLVPGRAEILVVAHTDQAQADIAEIRREVLNLPNGKSVTITTNRVTNETTYKYSKNGPGAKASGGRVGYASGGRLPRTGLGTDQILGIGSNGVPTAWVDDEEWVINARSSGKYDALLGLINADSPQVQGLAGLAKGGKAKDALSKASADRSRLSKELKADKKAQKAAQKAYDDIDGTKENRASKKAAKKRLDAAKKAVKATEKELQEARQAVSDLSSMKSELYTDVGRGNIQAQGESGLSGAYSLVDELLAASNTAGLSKKQKNAMSGAAKDAEKNFKALYATADKLEASMNKTKGHMDEMSSVSSSVASALSSGLNLSDAAQTQQVQKTNAMGAVWYEEKKATGSSIAGAATSYATKLRAFIDRLKVLAGWGASSAVLADIGSKGPDEGMSIASALSKKDVQVMNGAYSSIASLSAQGGLVATRNFTTADGTKYAGGLTQAEQAAANTQKQIDANKKSLTEQTTKVINAMGAPFNVTYSKGKLSTIVQKRAGGGWLYGPGTETSDSIPLLASRNEHLTNARQARANASVLNAINAGNGPVDLSKFVTARPAQPTTVNVKVNVPDIFVTNPFTGEQVRAHMTATATRVVTSVIDGALAQY